MKPDISVDISVDAADGLASAASTRPPLEANVMVTEYYLHDIAVSLRHICDRVDAAEAHSLGLVDGLRPHLESLAQSKAFKKLFG